jgi:(p)ppGpp synthase/HD superfamily hydrolase
LSTLERAIALAAKAHEGRVDKAGKSYILHPLRVMLRLSTPEEQITAVLHDVVEDCDVSLDALRAEGFSEIVIEAIDSVTKRKGADNRPEETYDAFVHRASSNLIGRRVKLADLEDNVDPSRIQNPTAKDLKRMVKYRRAVEYIRTLESNNLLL